VQREQVMLPLKVSSPEMHIGVLADGFAKPASNSYPRALASVGSHPGI
jgi:hypothetical protein